MDKVVHFELPADNVERAKAFYKNIFGWNIEKAGPMPYWIIHTVAVDEKMMPKESGTINGGMLHRDETNDPGSSKPVLVISVNDVKNIALR